MLSCEASRFRPVLATGHYSISGGSASAVDSLAESRMNSARAKPTGGDWPTCFHASWRAIVSPAGSLGFLTNLTIGSQGHRVHNASVCELRRQHARQRAARNVEDWRVAITSRRAQSPWESSTGA
jgi:hypothetical protein